MPSDPSTSERVVTEEMVEAGLEGYFALKAASWNTRMQMALEAALRESPLVEENEELRKALHGIRFTAQSAFLGYYHATPDDVEEIEAGPLPWSERVAEGFNGIAQRACDALGIENKP